MANIASQALVVPGCWRTTRIHTNRTWLVGSLLAFLLGAAAGCAAGRITDGVYRNAEIGFQVRLPPAAWLPIPMDGATLSFSRPDLQAAMALAVDCRAPERGALSWVARHLFFGLEEKRVQENASLRLHDTEAVRLRLRARMGDRPVEVQAVTLRRAGCLYDFLYVAPPAVFPKGHPDFEAFVESWTPTTGR